MKSPFGLLLQLQLSRISIVDILTTSSTTYYCTVYYVATIVLVGSSTGIGSSVIECWHSNFDLLVERESLELEPRVSRVLSLVDLEPIVLVLPVLPKICAYCTWVYTGRVQYNSRVF